jgi:hypothetical protein
MQRVVAQSRHPILPRLAGLACLLWIVLHGLPLHAQMVFPDLVPSGAVLVVSVPDAGRAWHALRSSDAYPAIQALRLPLLQLDGRATSEPRTGDPDLSLRNQFLFGDILSASEMTVVPGGQNGRTTAFLFLGKVRDLPALRKLLDALEQRLTRDVSSQRNPVTRQAESIGQTAVVLLSDAGSSIGYFVNGPQGICAISNDASLLRETARRLEKPGTRLSSKEDAKGEQSGFLEMARAWKDLSLTPGNHNCDVRFLIASPSRAPSGESAPHEDTGAASLLRSIGPRGGLAGGLSFGPGAIRMETFALFPEGGSTLMENLYRAASVSHNLPGADFATPDALMLTGNGLFAVPILKQSMIEILDQWSARIPKESASGLNPASARAQAQLALLRGWLSDPAFLAELGPSWFFALNDFVFLKPGEFPLVDLVLGFETRDPEATRRKMLALEADVLRAVEAWRGAAPENTDAPTSASLRARPAFIERPISLVSGTVPIRVFQMPQLPPSFRPTWAVLPNGKPENGSGHLLITLSPESLEAALQRQTKSQPDALFSAFRSATGMERAHAYQIIRPARGARILQAILQAVVAKRDPSLRDQIAAVAEALAHVDSIVVFRRAMENGVHTVGEIRIGTPQPPVQPPSGAARHP